MVNHQFSNVFHNICSETKMKYMNLWVKFIGLIDEIIQNQKGILENLCHVVIIKCLTASLYPGEPSSKFKLNKLGQSMFQQVSQPYTVWFKDNWGAPLTTTHTFPLPNFSYPWGSIFELLVVTLKASSNMCFLGGVSLVFVTLEQWISQFLKMKKDLEKMEHRAR